MTFPSNEKALTNHCLRRRRRRDADSIFPQCFYNYFCSFFVSVCCVQTCGSRQGSGIRQQTPLFMTEEMMRSASPSLSALGSLPLSLALSFFFSSPNWPWFEGRDCLGKDVKRICLVAHHLFQQSIKHNGEGKERERPSFF